MRSPARQNCFENIHEIAKSGLTIDEFGCRFNEIGWLELPRGAQRAGSRLCFAVPGVSDAELSRTQMQRLNGG